MAEFLQQNAIDVSLGLAIWLLALAIPFRRLAARPDIGWDVVAALGTTVFAMGADALLSMPVDWVMTRIDGWYALIENAAWWLVIPSYIVLADLGAYWAHRALHTRWLWSTHAWHHSAQYLYWLSGLRGSPIHILVLSAPYFLAFIIFPLPETAIVGLAILVLDASNQHYIHSNLKIPYAKQIERVLVTPRYHFVHHSAQPSIANSNYGFIFSVWDHLFHTYTDPDAVPVDDSLGLSYEISNWRLVLGLPSREPRDLTRAPIVVRSRNGKALPIE